MRLVEHVNYSILHPNYTRIVATLLFSLTSILEYYIVVGDGFGSCSQDDNVASYDKAGTSFNCMYCYSLFLLLVGHFLQSGHFYTILLYLPGSSSGSRAGNLDSDAAFTAAAGSVGQQQEGSSQYDLDNFEFLEFELDGSICKLLIALIETHE